MASIHFRKLILLVPLVCAAPLGAQGTRGTTATSRPAAASYRAQLLQQIRGVESELEDLAQSRDKAKREAATLAERIGAAREAAARAKKDLGREIDLLDQRKREYERQAKVTDDARRAVDRAKSKDKAKRRTEWIAADRELSIAREVLAAAQDAVRKKADSLNEANQKAQDLEEAQRKPAGDPNLVSRIKSKEEERDHLQDRFDALGGRSTAWQVASQANVSGHSQAVSVILCADPKDADAGDVITASLDRTVRRWHTARPGQLQPTSQVIVKGKGEIYGIARHRDYLVVGNEDGVVLSYSLQQGLASQQRIRERAGENQYVRALAFNPRQPAILATGSRDGKLELWDLTRPGAPPIAARDLKRTILSVSYSPGGDRLAVATRPLDAAADHFSFVFSVGHGGRTLDGEPLRLAHPLQVNCVAFHPHRNELVTTCADGITRWYRKLEPNTPPEELLSLTGKSPETSSVLVAAFGGPTGDWLVTADAEGWLKVYDLGPALREKRSPLLMAETRPHTGKVFAATFDPVSHPQGAIVFSGGVDNVLRVVSLVPKTAPARPERGG